MPVEPRIAADRPDQLRRRPVTLSEDGRLTGPFVRREGATRRFVYIAIGTSAGQHASEWSRRAKIDVHDILTDLLAQARRGECAGSYPARPRQGRRSCLCPPCGRSRLGASFDP